MASQVQYRRGTNAQNAAFTGALAEITVDTTNGTLRVHDAITVGGSNIATVSYVTSQISALSANSITNGTSSVAVIASGGNIRSNVAGATVTNISASLLEVTGNIAATNFITATTGVTTGTLNAQVTVGGTITGSTVSVTGNVVGSNVRVGTLRISANAISSSDDSITIGGTGTVGNVIIAGNLQVLGNTTTINSNNVTTNDLIISVANNAINSAAASGGGLDVGPIGSPFISWLYSSTANAWVSSGSISAAGNVLCNQLATDGIVNRGANGTGNIGSSTTYFNTVFAKATSAQYADLAEMYVSDQAYAPGTVVEFGGQYEITISSASHSTSVAGIISTNPSYLMNSAQTGEHVLPVALTGRVPCRVQGPVRKGDVLVASVIPGVAQRIGMNWQPGCILGKSMQVIDSAEIQIIEVAVGRT